MKKLTKIFAVFCAIICLSLAFTGCSKEEYSYWQTERQIAGENTLEYTAELSFGSSNIKVKEIWVNLSKVEFNPSSKQTTIEIELLKSGTNQTPSILTCNVTEEELKNSKDGWVQLYLNDEGIDCKQATVIVVDKMHVNEICFIKADATLSATTFSKAGVKAGNQGKLYTHEELEGLSENEPAYDANGNYAFNLVDEQDKFPLEYIQTQANN